MLQLCTAVDFCVHDTCMITLIYATVCALCSPYVFSALEGCPFESLVASLPRASNASPNCTAIRIYFRGKLWENMLNSCPKLQTIIISWVQDHFAFCRLWKRLGYGWRLSLLISSSLLNFCSNLQSRHHRAIEGTAATKKQHKAFYNAWLLSTMSLNWRCLKVWQVPITSYL